MGEAIRPDRLAASLAPDSMAAWVMSYGPASEAEALKLLRARYADRPLSLRLAALDFLMRRGGARGGSRSA